MIVLITIASKNILINKKIIVIFQKSFYLIFYIFIYFYIDQCFEKKTKKLNKCSLRYDFQETQIRFPICIK